VHPRWHHGDGRIQINKHEQQTNKQAKKKKLEAAKVWLGDEVGGANGSPRRGGGRTLIHPSSSSSSSSLRGEDFLSQYLAEIGPGGPRNAPGPPGPHRYLALPPTKKTDLQAREEP
jgi:hypothetical protein